MISIIVPIYNTSKYLKTCIVSILNQSFKDFELILINDGSTDESLSICKKYAHKDSRIRIIDKGNEGVDIARFTGLDCSIGEYITFVDSDDWLERDALNVMYKNIVKHNVDYSEIASQRVLDKMKLIKRKGVSPILGLIKQPELFEKYYISFFGYNLLTINIWGKLYKKETLMKACLIPSGLNIGEDLYFNLKLFPHLKSIYISNYIGYNYRYGGMTTKYNSSLFPNLKFLYQKKKEMIKKYSYDKANDFIRFEIVNVFKSDVHQQILYKYKSKKEIISYIKEELQNPLWKDIQDISNQYYLKKPFQKAIFQKDANYIYDFCKKEVDKKRVTYFTKRIISKLLSKYL